MGCHGCIAEEEQGNERDNFKEACFDYVSREIEKGNLIPIK